MLPESVHSNPTIRTESKSAAFKSTRCESLREAKYALASPGYVALSEEAPIAHKVRYLQMDNSRKMPRMFSQGRILDSIFSKSPLASDSVGGPVVMESAIVEAGLTIPVGSELSRESFNEISVWFPIASQFQKNAIPAGACFWFSRTANSPNAFSVFPRNWTSFEGYLVDNHRPVQWVAGDSIGPASFWLAGEKATGVGMLPISSIINRGIGRVHVLLPRITRLLNVSVDRSVMLSQDLQRLEEFWNAKEFTASNGVVIPDYSYVRQISDDRSIITLSKPTKIGRNIVASGSINYWQNRILIRTDQDYVLAGVKCRAGAVLLTTDYQLRGCTLLDSAIFDKVRVRAGGFEIRDDGRLVEGILADTLRQGLTTFLPGEIYRGSYQDTLSFVIYDRDELAAAISALAKFVSDSAPAMFVGIKKGGESIFGSFGAGEVKMRRVAPRATPQAISFALSVDIENFVRNPPFADCDVNIEADITFSWQWWHPPLYPSQLTWNLNWTHDRNIEVEPSTFCAGGRVALYFGALMAKVPSLTNSAKLLSFGNALTRLSDQEMNAQLGSLGVSLSYVEDLVIADGRLIARCIVYKDARHEP